ncbi:MAG: alanine/glycine:cation symporter family protein [Bryobacterales bacterium]|nr:alanine/glycine:cation symporter family protein [Bryobacterales bacterium]
MDRLAEITSSFAVFAWGPWLLVLLLGGGCYFFAYSRMLPFRHLLHAVQILLGRYDDPNDTGQIPHFQALSSALAGTIGMGNIAGVAVAIQTGGPGAVLWMWVCAITGIATKFFTCTLAIQFRGPDSRGVIQGGPMYAIENGLGHSWKLLAMFFSVCALFGTLPMFQVNQLVQILRDTVATPLGWISVPGDAWRFNLALGLTVAATAGWTLLGGIRRIGLVASRLVPAMVVLYLGSALAILLVQIESIPSLLKMIVSDAFSGSAVAGGAIGTVIVTGVRRAAFSNEAGIGSEALAHGAAKTNEPVREGLVAMLGPIIDTLIVCSSTALIILSTGTWEDTSSSGVTVTAAAFEQALPGIGTYILVLCVVIFAITTVLSCGYYGEKSLGYLIGAQRQHLYKYIYVTAIVVGSMTSLTAVLDFIDGMYGFMAIPTMTSSLLLSPHVMREARRYFHSTGSNDRKPSCC